MLKTSTKTFKEKNFSAISNEEMEIPYIMTALMLAVKMVQFAMCILCNCPCFMYDAGNTTKMVYWCFINVAKCT